MNPEVPAPSIDVVVPVYNGWHLTERCLEHLLLQTLPHSVIVCDNGSPTAPPSAFACSFPDVQVVELGTNLGFAAACNRGVRAGKHDIVVLLNNDVECSPDFLERLVLPLVDDEGLGSVAALLLKPGENRIESFGLSVDSNARRLPSASKSSHRARASDASRARRAVWCGRCVPPGGLGGCRGLDEGVFSYGEDVDLALRLRAAGWSTAGAADAVRSISGRRPPALALQCSGTKVVSRAAIFCAATESCEAASVSARRRPKHWLFSATHSCFHTILPLFTAA